MISPRKTAALLAVVLLVVIALAVSPAVAKQGPPGGGGGGGGGGHTEALGNNLSVPTIMIGGGFTGVTAPVGTPADVLYPTGIPLTGYPVEPTDYYYVQGTHKWQAQAYTVSSGTVVQGRAEWGDNLAGDAQLKAGSPIRVELGLFHVDESGAPDDSMQGFDVLKLEPLKLDRESAYGTVASGSEESGWSANAEFLAARIYDAGVTFSVVNLGTGAFVVPEGTNPTAEINATGKVVYGYNLRVSDAGEYKITFVIPSVDITGVDVGDFVTSETGPDTVSLTITVGGGGGGGGGGQGPPSRR
jgi:hypothetical protein